MKFVQLTLFLLAGALTTTAAQTAAAQTHVTKAPFGKLPDGSQAEVYTLTDAQLQVRITTYGAHLVSVDAPDKNGKRADVVLGYDSLAGYLADTSTHMGAVVGRYGNRIALASFNLNGHVYQLSPNNQGNTLHGGEIGFDRKNWSVQEIPNGVELSLVSPDQDMGFPGTLTAHVRYTLSGDKLRLDYTATTDKPTVINLTNHSYFNLAGLQPGGRDILNEVLQVNADRYTPVDAKLIPTGQLAPVAGTPFDFRQPTAIGARIQSPNDQLMIGGGYDENFVLSAPHTLAKAAAIVTDPVSGRQLRVYTTEPGVQLYTGNHLDGSFQGPDGTTYAKNDGFCLETQHFPNSPNQGSFPSTTLRPGQMYRTTTIFEFTTAK